mgnify:CR=1 FL=1
MDHAPLTPASFAARIAALRLPAAQVSVRVVHESSEHLAVVRGVVQPLRLARDAGAMVTVLIEHGTGYAASSDLSDSALHEAMLRAHQWAIASRDAGLFEGVRMPQPPARRLAWQSPHGRPLPSRAELIALLANEAAALRQHERILNWSATLTLTESEQWFYWNGECVAEQHHRFVEPNLEATAAQGSASQTRSLAGQYNGFCQQGGFEVIERSGLIGGGARVGAEALELLAAPNCPSGRMDLLLAPDQMMLQIHESIGHPLELDRILGDERNFAGTSFVTPQMFGSYAYGSEHLNVTFDPGIGQQLASCAADADGQPEREVGGPQPGSQPPRAGTVPLSGPDPRAQRAREDGHPQRHPARLAHLERPAPEDLAPSEQQAAREQDAAGQLPRRGHKQHEHGRDDEARGPVEQPGEAPEQHRVGGDRREHQTADDPTGQRRGRTQRGGGLRPRPRVRPDLDGR